MLGAHELVHLLEIQRRALGAPDAQAAAHHRQLAAREPLRRGRLQRGVRRPGLDHAQRLEEPLDRDIALLDRLGRDGLEQPSQAPVVYGGGNANTLGAELLEEHLLR